MGIFVTKASSILCYGYNNQIDENQRKAYETVFHQFLPVACRKRESIIIMKLFGKSNLYFIVRLHHRLHTEMVFDGTCVSVHLIFHGNVSSLVPRPPPSFPSLAVRYCKRREAGRGPGNEATM